MARYKNYRTLREQVMAVPGAADEVEAYRRELLAEIGLYELRRRHEVSQPLLGERLEVSQSAISKLEHAEDLRLSTLRDYVGALGGRLEVRACFEDGDVTLRIGDTDGAS
jgi:hypothetical protein